MGTVEKSLLIRYLMRKERQKSSSIMGTTTTAPNKRMVIMTVFVRAFGKFPGKTCDLSAIPQSMCIHSTNTTMPVKMVITAVEGRTLSSGSISEYLFQNKRTKAPAVKAFHGYKYPRREGENEKNPLESMNLAVSSRAMNTMKIKNGMMRGRQKVIIRFPHNGVFWVSHY